MCDVTEIHFNSGSTLTTLVDFFQNYCCNDITTVWTSKLSVDLNSYRHTQLHRSCFSNVDETSLLRADSFAGCPVLYGLSLETCFPSK